MPDPIISGLPTSCDGRVLTLDPKKVRKQRIQTIYVWAFSQAVAHISSSVSAKKKIKPREVLYDHRVLRNTTAEKENIFTVGSQKALVC